MYNVRVGVLSKGTGEAIEIAKRGDADVVLVHARELEEAFVAEGYGVHRVGVMYNDFLIVGPEDDPAGIRDTTNATYAFRKIAETGMRGGAIFVSRADRSGTNVKELEIWKRLGIAPSSKIDRWYLEAGAGMGTVIRMTNEKKAYTMTDRATWSFFRDQLGNLDLMTENDVQLYNPYGVIPVNPKKHPQRNYKMAIAFAKFIVSEEGQGLIGEFRKGGTVLYIPMAQNITKAHMLGFPDQEQELVWYDAADPYALAIGIPTVVESQRRASEPSLIHFFNSSPPVI